MKFFRFKTNENQVFSGIKIRDKLIPFENLDLSKKFNDILDFIINANKNDYLILENMDSIIGYEESNVRILSPFEKPAYDILCIGLNYQEHLDESINFIENIAPSATFFTKRAAYLLGNSDKILLDSNLDDALDYETELAIIIGKKGKNINIDDAMEYVFGYTILNDLSARSLQKNHGQWFKGKSLDGYTSMGPCIVHKSNIHHPLNLDITTKVNGIVRQNSNTKYMIRNVGKLISEISKGMTLFPGDIIATGTPSGVGLGFNPPKYLKDGDIVESEIECIGSLINKVVEINNK